MIKYIGLKIMILGLTYYSCNQNNQTITNSDKKNEYLEVKDSSRDKEEIQKLIQDVLNWSNSKESFDVLPILSDIKDSIIIGFDMKKHNANLDKLKETNFFTTEFIENYNHIILTLDRKLRNKEFEEWLVGDLPTFKFANDINPWCLCQDYTSGESGDAEIIQLNSKYGELKLKWKYDSSWIDFQFRVVKENNKWKISYLQGFDFKEFTKKDGEN